MKNARKLLMSLFAALALYACESTPPRYDLCVFYNDLERIYCRPSDTNKKEYTAKASTDYLLMSIDDYGKLFKYAKKVQKDLERCKK